MKKPFVTRLTFVASNRPEAQDARERLAARYSDTGLEEADLRDRVQDYQEHFGIESEPLTA